MHAQRRGHLPRPGGSRHRNIVNRIPHRVHAELPRQIPHHRGIVHPSHPRPVRKDRREITQAQQRKQHPQPHNHTPNHPTA